MDILRFLYEILNRNAKLNDLMCFCLEKNNHKKCRVILIEERDATTYCAQGSSKSTIR